MNPINSALTFELARTIDLQSVKLVASRLKSDLHGLATYLAVFDVALIAGGQIEQNTHRLRAKRTMNPALNNTVIHAGV